jgi:class 3 adenylate cyclase
METTSTVAGVAAAVARRLTALDRSQVWLSDQTGIPLTTLHRELRGQTPFNLDHLARVATALGDTVSSITAEGEAA